MFRSKRTPGKSPWIEGSIPQNRSTNDTAAVSNDTRAVSFLPAATRNTKVVNPNKPHSSLVQATTNLKRHSVRVLANNNVKTTTDLNLQRRRSQSNNNSSRIAVSSFDKNNELTTNPPFMHYHRKYEDKKISADKHLTISHPDLEANCESQNASIISDVIVRDDQKNLDILALAPLEIYQSFENEDRKLDVIWTPSMSIPMNNSDISWKSCVSNTSSCQVNNTNTKDAAGATSLRKLNLLNLQNEDITGVPIQTLSDILPGLKENIAEKRNSITKKKVIKLSQYREGDTGIPIVTLSELGFGGSRTQVAKINGNESAGIDEFSILDVISQRRGKAQVPIPTPSDSTKNILSLNREEDTGVRLVTLNDLICGGGSPIDEYVRLNGTNWVDTREKLIFKKYIPGFWARMMAWFKAPNVFKIHQSNQSLPLLNVSLIQNPFRYYFDGLDNIHFKVKPILQANSTGCWIVECTDTTCKYTDANGNEFILRNANVHFADGKYILGPLTYFENCHEPTGVSLLMENYASDETFVARKNRNARNVTRSPVDFQILQINNLDVNSEDKYFGSLVATLSGMSSSDDKFCLSFVRPLSALNKTLLTSGSLLLVHDFSQTLSAKSAIKN